MKTVAVYGSSAVKSHHADYIAAQNVGKALAQAGYAVMTGGYSGIMEAASRGAAEAGGRVIGVTTSCIETHRGPKTHVNQWVIEEIRQPTLRERLMYLILQSDAYIIMPGGLGTLTELALTWELIRVDELPTRPTICYGSYWADILASFRQCAYITPDTWRVLDFAETPHEVTNILKATLT